VTVALTSEWSGEPVTVAHVVDPVTGGVLFEGAGPQDGPCPDTWPKRSLEVDVFVARMKELARAFDARMMEVTAKASATALSKEWTATLGGRPPDQEDFARLDKLIEAECARLRNRRPETTPLQSTELFRRVREQYERLEREHGPATKA
jgi:hypothetical protein